jgi:hypothetical protein
MCGVKGVLFVFEGGIYEVINVDSKDYDSSFPKPVCLSEYVLVGWL